jgi:Domain of unknown function (DUF4276)
MFDYYAFPADAPGMADRPHGSPYARIQHVESALVKAIDDKRFVPNLILHEIEAWVFADCSRLGEVMGNLGPAAELESIVRPLGHRGRRPGRHQALVPARGRLAARNRRKAAEHANAISDCKGKPRLQNGSLRSRSRTS